MDLTNLMIIAGDIVTESKLSNQAKLQLLTWLENEATEPQLKAFLMDGQIVHLDEQAAEIVNARFETHPLNEGLLKTIFGMFLLSPPGWALYRVIRAAFSKNSRKCGTLAIGKTRDMCLVRAKMTKAEKMIGLVSREMKNCSQSKNPPKCKAKGEEKLRKWKGELKELQGRLDDLKTSKDISIG